MGQLGSWQESGPRRTGLATWTPAGSDAFVFTGPKSESLRRATFNDEWKRARTASEVAHLHFHDLRHTGNTLAASTGASTKELMARMGHASPRAALIYQHATTERDVAIAEALSAMVSGAREKESESEGAEHGSGSEY